MEDGIAGSHCSVLQAEGFPGDANSRLEGCLIHLDAHSAVAPDAETATGDVSRPSYKHLSACDVEIRLPVFCFRDRCNQCPSYADV